VRRYRALPYAFMLAYIAFKMGELHLGREGARDAAEADRYARAIAAYCSRLTVYCNKSGPLAKAGRPLAR